MPSKQTLGLLFVAVVLCDQAWWGLFEDADAAHGHSDDATAMQLFRPAVEQGAAAQ